MRLAIDCNTREHVLWFDLHVFRRVFGFCWKKPDGRKWRHLAWFYYRPYPPRAENAIRDSQP